MQAAARPDLAAAVAEVLLGDGHDGITYELADAVAFTLAELARLAGDAVTGPLRYVDLPAAAFEEALVEAGLERRLAANLADHDRAIASDELVVDTGDLRRLAGRPLVGVAEAVRAAG